MRTPPAWSASPPWLHLSRKASVPVLGDDFDHPLSSFPSRDAPDVDQDSVDHVIPVDALYTKRPNIGFHFDLHERAHDIGERSHDGALVVELEGPELAKDAGLVLDRFAMVDA